MTDRIFYVAVCGTGDPNPDTDALAEEAGRLLAEKGAIVVCGGLGGVMEAACRGADSAGGLSVGLLPGDDRSAANEHLDIALPTGLGEMRNALIVRAADAVIAVGGGWGTLSEIALARKTGVKVISLGPWEMGERPGVIDASTPAEAVEAALE